MPGFTKSLFAATAAVALTAGAAQAEIAIATAGPMTGQYATFGEQMQKGAERAVADINAAGGVLGEQLALHPPDTSRAPSGARLLLKSGRPYQEAVDTFSPYKSIQDPQPDTRHAAAKLIDSLRNQAGGRKSYLYVNNRLEGNALGTIAAILELLAAM